MDVLSLSNESEEMGRAGGVVVLLIMLVVCVQVEVGHSNRVQMAHLSLCLPELLGWSCVHLHAWWDDGQLGSGSRKSLNATADHFTRLSYHPGHGISRQTDRIRNTAKYIHKEWQLSYVELRMPRVSTAFKSESEHQIPSVGSAAVTNTHRLSRHSNMNHPLSLGLPLPSLQRIDCPCHH